jgi:hypothetical protein
LSFYLKVLSPLQKKKAYCKSFRGRDEGTVRFFQRLIGFDSPRLLKLEPVSIHANCPKNKHTFEDYFTEITVFLTCRGKTTHCYIQTQCKNMCRIISLLLREEPST